MIRFIRNGQVVFESGSAILHFHQQRKRVPVALHLCPFGIARFWISVIFRKYVIEFRGLNLQFPNDKWYRVSFLVLSCHPYTFFGEVPFLFFTHFLIRFFKLKVLCIFFDTKKNQACFVNIFSQCLVFSFS